MRASAAPSKSTTKGKNAVAKGASSSTGQVAIYDKLTKSYILPKDNEAIPQRMSTRQSPGSNGNLGFKEASYSTGLVAINNKLVESNSLPRDNSNSNKDLEPTPISLGTQETRNSTNSQDRLGFDKEKLGS